MTSCFLSRENQSYRTVINGSWRLDEITYEGYPGKFKSTLFDDAPATCFTGSTWLFRNNNSTGSYELNASGCVNGKRHIRWSVYEPGNGMYLLQFKRTDARKRDAQGGVGYRMVIRNVAAEKMILSIPITLNGKPFDVVLHYVKI